MPSSGITVMRSSNLVKSATLIVISLSMPCTTIVATMLASCTCFPPQAISSRRSSSRSATRLSSVSKVVRVRNARAFASASACFRPSPLLLVGRVATDRYSRMTCPLAYSVVPRPARSLKTSSAWRCSALLSSVADKKTLVSSIARPYGAVTLTSLVAVYVLARPCRRSVAVYGSQLQWGQGRPRHGLGGGGLENRQEFLLKRAPVPARPLAQGSRDGAGNVAYVKRDHDTMIALLVAAHLDPLFLRQPRWQRRQYTSSVGAR